MGYNVICADPPWRPGIEMVADCTGRTLPNMYEHGTAPRGPNGRRLCRWCGREVSNTRRSYCNADCLEEYNIRSNPTWARWRVIRRDKGVCARCGIDTSMLWDAIRMMGRDVRNGSYNTLFRAFLADNGLHYEAHDFEVHHKHAIAEGGGPCGLDGLETLCVRCHKRETSFLRKRASRTPPIRV